MGLVELGDVGKVKISEFFEQRKESFLNAAFAAILRTTIHLFFRQRRQIVFMRPVGLGLRLCRRPKVFDEGREAIRSAILIVVEKVRAKVSFMVELTPTCHECRLLLLARKGQNY